jgi:hypothetical protein
MSGSQTSKSPGAGGKRIPKENPKFGTQPGVRTTQKDRISSSSSVPVMGSPQRHGIVSPMQQAHDTSAMLRDLLARVVRVEAKVEKEDEEQTDVEPTQDLVERLRKMEAKVETAEGNVTKMEAKVETAEENLTRMEQKTEELKELVGKMAETEKEGKKLKDKLQKEREEGERRDDEIRGLTSKIRKMEEEKTSKEADEVEVKRMGNVKEEERKKEKERLDKANEEMNKMKVKMTLMEDEVMRRKAEVSEQLRNLKETTAERLNGVTKVKGVVEPEGGPEVEPNDSQWEGVTGDGEEYVILTDSNGAGVTETTVKRHIPTEKQRGCRIRVYTTYTLFEAFDKIKAGKIKVEGKRVIMDVTTNDVRGTRGLPRTRPDELVDRVGKVVAVLKEKGARGVTVCEPKPMTLMDMSPYSDGLRQKCRDRKVGWCQTQLGVNDLKEDGFHLLPSSLRVLDKTYAFAIMGVKVPHPTPIYLKWRHKLMEQEWPRMRGREELNVWRRREEERRMRT